MSKRKPTTTLEDKARVAYEDVPEEERQCSTYDELPEEAKEIWRNIARRRWANGG